MSLPRNSISPWWHSIYGPNEDSPEFFENLKSKLVSLSNTSIIIGGDWNVVQDFSFDTNVRKQIFGPVEN
jgi:hypothetical protein